MKLGRTAYVTLLPLADRVVFLAATESYVADRRLEKVGVFTSRGTEKPEHMLPVLHLVSLERLSDLVDALKRVVAVATDPRIESARASRLVLTVDVSDPIAGQIAAKRAWEVAQKLNRQCRLSIVDSSIFDLPAPEKRGWRMMIPRRSVGSALFESLQENRLKVDLPYGIGREAAQQIKVFTAKPNRDDYGLDTEDLARTIATTVFLQSILPS